MPESNPLSRVARVKSPIKSCQSQIPNQELPVISPIRNYQSNLLSRVASHIPNQELPVKSPIKNYQSQIPYQELPESKPKAQSRVARIKSPIKSCQSQIPNQELPDSNRQSRVARIKSPIKSCQSQIPNQELPESNPLSNKILFQMYALSLFSIILFYLTWWILRIKYGGWIKLRPLVMTCQLWIWRQTLANEKMCYKIIALELQFKELTVKNV